MKKDFSSFVFQERLNEFKENRGLNNEDLASAAKISSQAVFNYFKIGSIPKLNVLACWSSKLGLSADWLLSGIGEMLLSSELSKSGDVEQPISSHRDTVLEMLIVQIKELNEKINDLTRENATLKANEKLLSLSIEGKQHRSNASHASGAGNAVHSSRGGTE